MSLQSITPMTSVAILSTYLPFGHLVPLFEQADPSLDILVWPDPRCMEAEIAACLHPPKNIFEKMPRLQLVHCVSAGVDSVLVDQNFGSTPLCRVVDPTLSSGMVEYVLWGVLHFHRRFDKALSGQPLHQWNRLPRTAASTCCVGVMGLGALGKPVATHLAALGYDVRGWARTLHEIPGVDTFAGETGFDSFLSAVDILVCTLPLTPQTHSILNARTFGRLKPGAALIHCGRGEQMVEHDLRSALEARILRGALVDVFPNEPLPPESPMWDTPGLIVTPHMASTASDAEIVKQIVRNIHAARDGQPLTHQVDLDRGY